MRIFKSAEYSACRRGVVIMLLGSVFFASAAAAETMYVTDILRLGLHNSSDTSDSPFRTLVSGDALEILERRLYYARVRTEDGVEGWVKFSYLIDEKPAQTRLAEFSRERDELAIELAGLSARLEETNSQLASVSSSRDQLQQQVQDAATELTTLRADNKLLNEKVAAYRFSLPAHWIIGIGFLTLLGGFLGGWWWTDARQRARHGGFRI